MNGFWTRKRIVIACILLVSLLFVLFVGRSFNSETFERERILTTKGINHFRKGLDISGGTKLVYKIDYTKYEEIYSASEFAEVKKSIEEVILKNIDSRISTLWVSDYKSYIQRLADETQVVVEIWGIADLDQAKKIIGKTVELEFRLQNEDDVTDETIAQRKQLAEKVRADAIINPDKMIQLYENQEAENVFAQSYSWTLRALPEIYSENLETLNNIPLNQISELIEGTYTTSSATAEDGSLITEPINGFLTFRVVDRSAENKTTFSSSDILSIAEEKWLTYEIEDSKDDKDIPTWEYIIEGNSLIYNVGEAIDTNAAGYKVRIIQIEKDSTIGKENNEIEEIDERFDADVAAIEEALKADSEAIIETGSEVANNYLSEETITQYIPDYEPKLWEVNVYNEATSSYIVYTKEIKEEGEQAFMYIIINDIADTEDFENSLKNQIVYTIDEIFVQDRLNWKLAQGNDGSPLNGAYFTIAKAETTQLWEPSVGIEFNGKGRDIFCEVTSNNVGKSMGIFIGGKAATIATIQTKICDGRAQISWGFDRESAQETAKELNSGNMPAPLILLQEEKISPSLWDSAFQGALVATAVGILAIILYIFFIYGRRNAIVTAWTMISFMIVLAAFLKLIDYALSLSGIAAIILSIGMAVDANILIFERMNEEIKEGKTYLSAIQTATKRSWAAIRDGQISTLLIGLLLFAYGINMFKWFGSMIILTALLTLILNIPIIKELLIIMYNNKKD